MNSFVPCALSSDRDALSRDALFSRSTDREPLPELIKNQRQYSNPPYTHPNPTPTPNTPTTPPPHLPADTHMVTDKQGEGRGRGERMFVTSINALGIGYLFDMIKSTEEKTEEFFKTVEAGDIALFDLFEEAIAVFGFTKVGKTSSCHYLSNSILRAEMQNGDLIFKPTTQKFVTAKVGVTNESETEIPNIFEARFRDKKKEEKRVFLLDQPGYGDSYGFHRIFSNGYFHYRTFSKTPKLKFILAFNKNDLQGTAEKFKKTIFNFINTFARYEEIKKQILAATSFLITKAEPKSKIEDIKKILVTLKTGAVSNMAKGKIALFQEIIQHMVENDKVFVIEKPEQVGFQTRQTNTLQTIYDKTEFWVRDVNKNIVDMSEINFSVASEILNSLNSYGDNELFKEEYAHFMNFMSERMSQILVKHEYSLKNIINILTIDAESGLEDHTFLEAMDKFNAVFYKFQESYRDKREKREVNLFRSNETVDSDQSKGNILHNQTALEEKKEREKEMKMNYFIKKFKVLEFIIEKTEQIEASGTDRSIEELEGMSQYFIQIFRKLNILRFNRQDSEKIIYRYTYVIQRLIEEAKIITLILFNKPEFRHKFEEYSSQNEVAFVDIYRTLKDKVFAQMNDIHVPLLKERFTDNIDIESLEVINEEIINFFEPIFNKPNLSNRPMIRLLIKYSTGLYSKKKQPTDKEKKYVAMKLFDYRQKGAIRLKDNLANETLPRKEKEELVEQVVCLSNSLGAILASFTYFQIARGVYESIHNSYMVFKMYDQQISHEESNSRKRELLLKYGQYASFCHRKQLALKCYQEAYDKSSSYKQFQQISTAIQKLCCSVQDSQALTSDPYLKKFYNEIFCEQIDKQICSMIEIVCTPPEESN